MGGGGKGGGSDVSKGSRDGSVKQGVQRTPSYWALFDSIGEGDYEQVEKILALTADPLALLRKKDLQGLTPLRKAVVLSKADICFLLIQYGAEPSVTDPVGKTVLHRAATMGCRNLIAPLLVSPDSCVNVQDKFGWSPLHYAVRGKHLIIVDWLLFLGADVNVKNNEEESPLDICPKDSPMYPYLKRHEARDLNAEPVQMACTYMEKKSLSKLGSDGQLIMVTSELWPNVSQFILCVRKRPSFSSPPIPLRKDESFMTDVIQYRLKCELPDGKTRVCVYFSVFSVLKNYEIVMKITSRTKFLGEVPVTVSTYVKNNFINYRLCAELDLKNQGQFVLVKRPAMNKMIFGAGFLFTPEIDNFMIAMPEDTLPSWPSNFEERREEIARQENEILLQPFAQEYSDLMKQDLETGPTEKTDEEQGNDAEIVEGQDNQGDESNNAAQSESKILSKDKKTVKGKQLQPVESDSTPRSSVTASFECVALDGNEPDITNDFYYISEGWGTYVKIRHNINHRILLELQEPGSSAESLMRCATKFYTISHSSNSQPNQPVTIQIPKDVSHIKRTEGAYPEFQKVGTVLVFVRKSEEEEQSDPDPDDMIDEWSVAEDGKSTRLEYWLAREAEKWSVLPFGIVNKQSRVIFETDVLSTFIVVQLTVGTEKWKAEEDDSSEDSSDEGASDDEGEDDGDGENDGERDAEDDSSAKKKKKKKKSKLQEKNADEEGKSENASEKKDKEINKSANNKSNNKSTDKKDEEIRKSKGAKLTAVPVAPRPSPQPSLTDFKDTSSSRPDSELTDSSSSYESSSDDENINNSGVNKPCRRGANKNNSNSLKPPEEQANSKRTSATSVTYDPFKDLYDEERTIAKGMPQVSTSFFSLEPRPAPVDEDMPEEAASEEMLPSPKQKKKLTLGNVMQQGELMVQEFDYGSPLNETNFDEMDSQIDVKDSLLREVALMWRYRNHKLTTLAVFLKTHPIEKDGSESWDVVLEMVADVELELRAEMWFSQGFKLCARNPSLPLKSLRQLQFTVQTNNVSITGPESCQPGKSVLLSMWYATNQVNYLEFKVKKQAEPKGLKKGGGGKKKEEKAEKLPELMILGELFYPGKVDNLIQTKEIIKLPAFFDAPSKWDDEHIALRAKDDELLDKLVLILKETPAVTDVWWKVWLLLGYSEVEVEKEKVLTNSTESISKIIQRWFKDNVDATDRGILKVLSVLYTLGLEETFFDIIQSLKEYKVNNILPEKKPPRFKLSMFHWLNDTKITENSLKSLMEPEVMSPIADMFLQRLADQIVLENDLLELGAALDVDDNQTNAIMSDDEYFTDLKYKAFKLLIKSRQKNDDIIKFLIQLLDMVKKINQPREVGDWIVQETRRWMNTQDHKDICIKLENVLITYVPNRVKSALDVIESKTNADSLKDDEEQEGETEIDEEGLDDDTE